MFSQAKAAGSFKLPPRLHAWEGPDHSEVSGTIMGISFIMSGSPIIWYHPALVSQCYWSASVLIE